MIDEDLLIVETYMSHVDNPAWIAFSKLREILMAWDNMDINQKIINDTKGV